MMLGRCVTCLASFTAAFGDLGAGVGVEERVDRAGRELGELGGERLEQVVGEHVDLGVEEALRLVGDRLHHLGWA